MHVVRTFTVTARPEQALAYLADSGHAEAGGPDTGTCVRTDAGPVAVGAT